MFPTAGGHRCQNEPRRGRAARRRLIFVLSACQGAIERLDPVDLDELGPIMRLEEIATKVEADLDRLALSN
jgi:hypothetical protein